jgi:hypothetical protein
MVMGYRQGNGSSLSLDNVLIQPAFSDEYDIRFIDASIDGVWNVGATNFNTIANKFDTNGNVLHHYKYEYSGGGSGNDRGIIPRKVLTSGNRVFILGWNALGPGGSTIPIITTLTNDNGNHDWSLGLDTSSHGAVYALGGNLVGNKLYTVGYSSTTASGIIISCDLDGTNHAVTKLDCSTRGIRIRDIAPKPNSTNYYIVADSTNQALRMTVAEMTAAGNIVWIKTLTAASGISSGYPLSLSVTSTGDLIVSGYITSTGQTHPHGFVVKMDNLGNVLNHIGWGTETGLHQIINSSVVYNDVIHAVGQFVPGDTRAMYVQLDSNLNVISQRVLSETNNSKLYFQHIHVDGNNIIITGEDNTATNNKHRFILYNNDNGASMAAPGAIPGTGYEFSTTTLTTFTPLYTLTTTDASSDFTSTPLSTSPYNIGTYSTINTSVTENITAY